MSKIKWEVVSGRSHLTHGRYGWFSYVENEHQYLGGDWFATKDEAVKDAQRRALLASFVVRREESP